MFEFQTAMSELTGLPVSNAALYEGPSAVASAAYLAIGATGRRKLVASRGVHPHSRESLVTYGAGYGTELVEVPLADGVTDPAALAEAIDDETAAVFLQQPNFLGAVEDIEALGAAAKEHGALVVVACDPIALSILRPPGECGADIAVGEGQPLGNRLDYGGPSFGFFCATEEHIRRMPGPDRRGDRPTSTAAAASSSRSRRASSTSAARRRPTTSAPPRRSTRWPGWSTSPGSASGASSSSGSCSCGAPPMRASAWARVDGRRAPARGAGGPRVRGRARRPGRRRCSTAVRLRGSAPAIRWRASTRSTRTGCWSRSPSGAAGQDIDRLADVLGRAVADLRRRQGRGGGRIVSDGPPTTVDGGTPMQRDRATTIYERSVRGAPSGRRCRTPACRRRRSTS